MIYATLCELIKYTADPEVGALLGSFGVTPDKWLLFIYNDSEEPETVLRFIFLEIWQIEFLGFLGINFLGRFF